MGKTGSCTRPSKKIESLVEQYFTKKSNRAVISAGREKLDDFHVFRIASVPDVSQLKEAVALIVGDCVHNIRSALDHLAYQLALLHKDGKVNSPYSVQFPIANTAERFTIEAKKGLGEVMQEYQKVIESYQPYHGLAGRPDSWSGSYTHQLSLLQELSNTDKHRLLNPVLLIPNRLDFRLPEGINHYSPNINSVEDSLLANPFRNAGEKLEIGIEVFRGKLQGIGIPDTILDAGYVIPHISLEEKRPISPTLERLENYVRLILKDFQERLFLKPSKL